MSAPDYKLADVEQCVDPGLLSGLIEKLEIGSLSEDDAANVRLFRQALERRAQGKPDFNFMSLDYWHSHLGAHYSLSAVCLGDGQSLRINC